MTCHENQNRADLVDALFNTRDESETPMDRLNATPTSLKNRNENSTIHTHRPSKSIQTLDSRISERSQPNYSQQTGSKSTSIKVKTNIYFNTSHTFWS